MKFSIRTGKITRQFWQQFLPGALCCVFFVLVGIARSIVMQSLLYGSDSYIQKENFFTALQLTFLMGLLFSVAAACLGKKYGVPRLWSWVAAAAGLALGFLCRESSAFTGLAIACIFLFLRGVQDKEKPSLSLCRTAGWFCTSFGITLVLYLCLLLLCGAVFSLLILSENLNAMSITSVCCSLMCFCVVFPWLFLGGLPDGASEEKSGFHKLCYKILLPVYLALVGILILYILKILVTFRMPVGELNPYALLALTAFAALHLLLTGEESKMSRWFKTWGSLLMIPIVIAQCIGVYIRIDAYGFTTIRILGLAWTALCVAVLILQLCRKQANWFFPAAALVALLLFCSPLRAENLALWNQEARFKGALQRNNMLNAKGEILPNPDAAAEDRLLLYSAMDYLVNAPAREGSLTHQLQTQLGSFSSDGTHRIYVSYKDKEKLLGFEKPSTVTTWNMHSYRFNGTAVPKKLDTRGYAYAEYITCTQQADGKDITEKQMYFTCDMKRLSTLAESLNQTGTLLNVDFPVLLTIDGETADLAPLLQNLICNHDTPSALIRDKLTFPSGKVFHIDTFQVYHYRDDRASSLTLSGWLMTPDAK